MNIRITVLLSWVVMMVCTQQGSSYAATVDANSVTGNLIISSAGVTTLISMISYVCAVGLGLTGVWKVKQHADNPLQTGLREGVIRLIICGALTSLPFIMAAMQGSANPANIASGGSGGGSGSGSGGGTIGGGSGGAGTVNAFPPSNSF